MFASLLTADWQYFLKIMTMVYQFLLEALLTDIVIFTFLASILYVIKLKLTNIALLALLLQVCWLLLYNWLQGCSDKLPHWTMLRLFWAPLFYFSCVSFQYRGAFIFRRWVELVNAVYRGTLSRNQVFFALFFLTFCEFTIE